MYAVKELMGEHKFNAILSQFIVDHENPKRKPTATDLVNAILHQALPKHKKFINDCFNEVVTYDLGIKVINYKKLSSGKFKVDLEIDAERLSTGNKQLPDLEVDLACFDQLESDWEADTKAIYTQKIQIKQHKTKFSIIVAHKPKTVAIDPYGYVLDVDKSDHVAVVD